MTSVRPEIYEGKSLEFDCVVATKGKERVVPKETVVMPKRMSEKNSFINLHLVGVDR